MGSDVVRFIALYLILRIVVSGVVSVAFVIEIFRVHLNDRTPDAPRFGIPFNMIANLKFICHCRNQPSLYPFQFSRCSYQSRKSTAEIKSGNASVNERAIPDPTSAHRNSVGYAALIAGVTLRND